MIIQLVHFTFASEDADKAETMFRALRDASRKEDGVLGFDVARGQDDPNVFVLWEQYKDRAALDAHMATEQFKELVIDGLRRLAKQRAAEIVVPIRSSQP